VTGDNVAVKIVSTKKIQPDELASLHSEIGILKMLDHPNIIKYVVMRSTGLFLV
jgi:serine/threonine protein kinase